MVNVIFNFTDSGGNELYTKLFISPSIGPLSYGTNIVSNDSVIVYEQGTAVTASLVPNTYNIRLMGINCLTEFLITVPTGSENSTINAKDYIVGVVPTQNFTASYALNAVSSSYALTASYALNEAPVSSASYAVSASYAPAPATSSYALTAISASYLSGSYANVTNFTASNVLIGGNINLGGSLYVPNQVNAGHLSITNSAVLGASAIIQNSVNSNLIGPDFNVYMNATGINPTASWNVQGSHISNPLDFHAFLTVLNNNDGTANVGINNNAPAYALDVNGNLHATTIYLQNGIQANSLFMDTNLNLFLPGTGGNSWNIIDDGTDNVLFSVYDNGDGSGITTIGGQGGVATLSIIGDTGNVDGDYYFANGTGQSWINSNGGNVGIGNNNPNYPLDVTGAINASGTITGLQVTGTNITANSILTANGGYVVPITQAGSASVSAATAKAISFGHSFPNTNYSVTLNVSGSSPIACGYYAKATGGFTASFASSFTGTVNWIASANTQ